MPSDPGQVVLGVSRRAVVRAVAAAIALLVALHLLSILVERSIGHDDLPGTEVLVRLFSMDGELNAPTWFSSSLLLACGALAALVGAALRARGEGDWHWWALAGVLAFLSLDEAALIHEELSKPITRSLDLDAEQWDHWAWVGPYLALAAVFAVTFVRFLRRLPATTARLLVLAGAVYVAGAGGMELVGRAFWDADDVDAAYLLVVGVEETLELIGMTVLVHALLGHLGEVVGPLHVRWAGGQAAAKRSRT